MSHGQEIRRQAGFVAQHLDDSGLPGYGAEVRDVIALSHEQALEIDRLQGAYAARDVARKKVEQANRLLRQAKDVEWRSSQRAEELRDLLIALYSAYATDTPLHVKTYDALRKAIGR